MVSHFLVGLLCGTGITASAALIIFLLREEVYREAAKEQRDTFRSVGTFNVGGGVVNNGIAVELFLAEMQQETRVVEWILDVLLESPREMRTADADLVRKVFRDPLFPRFVDGDAGDLERWLTCECGCGPLFTRARVSLAWPLRFLPNRNRDGMFWIQCVSVVASILNFARWNTSQSERSMSFPPSGDVRTRDAVSRLKRRLTERQNSSEGRSFLERLINAIECAAA